MNMEDLDSGDWERRQNALFGLWLESMKLWAVESGKLNPAQQIAVGNYERMPTVSQLRDYNAKHSDSR